MFDHDWLSPFVETWQGNPSSLVPNLTGNLGTIHDTNYKAVQIVENGTVDLQASQTWIARLLSQGSLDEKIWEVMLKTLKSSEVWRNRRWNTYEHGHFVHAFLHASCLNCVVIPQNILRILRANEGPTASGWEWQHALGECNAWTRLGAKTCCSNSMDGL